MKQIKIFIVLLIALMSLNITIAKADNGIWRLDGFDITKVINFRVSSSTTSASAQPSIKALPLLYDYIKSESLSKTEIYLVDLRQESHGFANGFPVSYYKEHNHANLGKNSAEIQADEIERLKSVLGKQTQFLPLGKHDEATLSKVTLIVNNIQNEKHAAEQIGFKYIRFSAADMIFPEPATVDEFIKFYLSLPKNHWLHFHCHAGHGRTTTFLVFYDILTYPDLTLDEIVKKEFSIGGSNLLAESSGEDWYSQMHRDRIEKLKLFYKYVQENRGSKFKTSWSDYLKLVEY